MRVFEEKLVLLSHSPRTAVISVHVVPSVDLKNVPELPTATKNPVSTVKEVIANVLLAFPAESLTIIVQSVKVPSLKEVKVIVLFPLIADVVSDEQEPPYVMVPASSEEKV